MKNYVFISKKIKNFNRKIQVQPDKSISIRWALMASQAIGKSRGYNLLDAEDVNSTLNALKKIGIKVIKKKNYCDIYGKGLNGFSYKKNTVIDAGNSGTLSRLILGLLAGSKNPLIIKGDKSLSSRDFGRVIKPLNLFGVKISSKNNKLPLKINGTDFLRPIDYEEHKGSAQVKSCIMLAALNTPGKTKIKCLKSRNHTEKLFKFLKLPIKVNKKDKNYQLIEIKGKKQYKSFNYKIPGDISSSAFFIILTVLSKNSQITIKDVNINKSRTGIIDALKKMNVKIKFKNFKIVNEEPISDIIVKSTKNLKSINCPVSINSRAIDELPLLFLICARAKGVSSFKKIEELRNKESDRLKMCSKFLKMIGIKIKETKDSLKIYGNPKINLNKKFEMKNFMKDHRIFMMSCIAALTLGGVWKINDKDSIKTSFPKFISILKKIGAKIA